MSSGKRPGGLTALAVFNFIFGGLGLLSMGALGVAIGYLSQNSEEVDDENLKQLIELAQETGGVLLGFILLVSVVSSILLLASAIGYLKLKRFLGRTLGNAYGVLSLIYVAITAATLDPLLGGGFGLPQIIGLIYPILTLFLLNVTFKEDFTN